MNLPPMVYRLLGVNLPMKDAYLMRERVSSRVARLLGAEQEDGMQAPDVWGSAEGHEKVQIPLSLQWRGWAAEAYARAVEECGKRDVALSGIRIEVLGPVTEHREHGVEGQQLQPLEWLRTVLLFNGAKWVVHEGSLGRAVVRAGESVIPHFLQGPSFVKASGRSYLVLENGNFLLLEQGTLGGSKGDTMLEKNRYSMEMMKKDGSLHVEGPSEDLFYMVGRFQAMVKTVQPKQARLYMEAQRPDGTPYQHDIGVWRRAVAAAPEK